MSDQDRPEQNSLFARLDTALRFLSSLPLPWPSRGGLLGPALPCFPLVGALIGGLLLGIGWLGGIFWPPLSRAAVIVVAWGVISGGLHLDGLSDTFDAVMSWRDRNQKLAIMKDSRIGAMGSLAIVGVLMLKLTLLADAGASWWRAVLAAPIIGRWAMIYATASFPAARPSGLGSMVQGQLGRSRLLAVSAAVALACAVIAGAGGVCALLLAWAGTHLLGRWWTHDLGGLTGDTYGAVCELAEVLALATISAAARVNL